MRQRRTRRPGFGLVMVTAVLAVTSIVLATITMQILTNRRAVAQREGEIQAEWLARSGIELALQKRQADPDYAGEKLDYAPLGVVRIETKRKGDVVEILSEATVTGQTPIVREDSRRYRETRGKLEPLRQDR